MAIDEEAFNRAAGSELRAARARRKWSRAQLEQESCIPQASIKRYEDGDRALPLPTLARLLDALGVSFADFDAAIRRALGQ